jgi:hypothetical protein
LICFPSRTDHPCDLKARTFVNRCVQVHGTVEAADAARTPPRWRQLLWLIYDALRRPLLWFFIAVGFLWGAWAALQTPALQMPAVILCIYQHA